MHIIIPIILLFLAIFGYQMWKYYQRVKPIGKAQTETQDLKAQQELKDINQSNSSIEQNLEGKDDE